MYIFSELVHIFGFLKISFITPNKMFKLPVCDFDLSNLNKFS